MIDIEKFASNLIRSPDGIWRASQVSAVSYPEKGNDFCYQLEETSFWFRHRNQVILRVVRAFPPNGIIFDIGGGNGFVAAALQEAGFETVLVEPGEGVFNAQKRGLPVIIHAALQDAGFHPDTLPAAGMFDVLEHLSDDLEFLRFLASRLQPGGRLYLTVPAFSWLWSVVDDVSGHYRRYSLQSLQAVVEKAGLTVEYASYFFHLMLLPMVLFRVLPLRLGLIESHPVQRLRSELAPLNFLNALLTTLLGLELSALGERSYRWGTSCILVARRK